MLRCGTIDGGYTLKHVGDCVIIDKYPKRTFVVNDIHQYVKDGVEIFTDYVLDESIRLRFLPSLHVLLLNKYDEMLFNKELDTCCRKNKSMEITCGKKIDKYWRVGDSIDSHEVDVHCMKESKSIEYWDYYTASIDNNNKVKVQYLFVCLEDNGLQTMWKGEKLDADAFIKL